MPDVTSLSLQIVDQETGNNDNTWGDIADLNFANLEQAIANISSIAVTGGTLTPDADTRRKSILIFTGVLVSNQTIIVADAAKRWHVKNETTGAFTLTVKTSAGNGKIVPRGQWLHLFCDGTNVNFIRQRGVPWAQCAGSANVLTALFDPAINADELVDGFMVRVRAILSNTSTSPTFSHDNGVTNYLIKKLSNTDPRLGDIDGNGHELLLSYSSVGPYWLLLNPTNIGEDAKLSVEIVVPVHIEAGANLATFFNLAI
jgi:hypothetical protein